MASGLPLLAAQSGIWVGQALDPNSADFVTAECVELHGVVDVPALLTATQRALREVDVLGGHLLVDDDGVRLQTESAYDLAPRVVDVPDQSDARAWMAADSRVPFDLRAGPLVRHALLRVADGTVYWYLAAHHIALDGYAYTLIVQRAGELYGQQVEQRVVQGEPFASLEATVTQEQQLLGSPAWQRSAAFWREQLARMPEPVSLAAGRAAYPSVPRRVSFDLDAAAFARLQALSSARGPSWVHALSALFASFVQTKTGASEVVLGLPVLAREGRVALRSPVMMMNIVPVALGFSHEETLAQRAVKTQGALNAVLPHARYRYEQMRRDASRVGGQKRLFGPVLNIMPFERAPRFGALRAHVHPLAAGPVEDLSLSVHPLPRRTGLRLMVDAHPALYGADALHNLADELRTLLNSEQPLATLRAAAQSAAPTEIELHAPAAKYPAEDVLSLVLAHARHHGHRIALEHADEALSYRELTLRAAALADQLRARGVEPGALVALCLPRSSGAIVAMLATLLCGAAYVPLDPEGPVERARDVLFDARPKLVVVASHAMLSQLQLDAVQALVLAPLPLASTLPTCPAAPDPRAAYVIYTSGSTGRPNGVVVSRASLAHFVAAARETYRLGEDDRVLQFAPLAFDASVEEIFVTLAVGGCLVLREPDMLDSPAHFLSRCAALSVNLIDLPTAFFHELAFAMARSQLALPSCVHTVIIGGEAALPERVRDFLGASRGAARLLNTYGPTETTVVATCADLSQERDLHDGSDIPIGHLLPGLSAVLRPEPGSAQLYQLSITGPTLASGYLGQAAITAERFVPLDAQRRAYRTGDLVRVRADGALIFAERTDDQLKISGHRVELGEVERALTRHPAVRDVAVVVERMGSQKRLIAHVVSSSALTPAALREHARKQLLAAAVPSSFLMHEALPRTATGKVDRRALTRLALPDQADEQLLENELQRTVRAVWQEVLGQRDIELDQDFFELGGQSLQTIQIASRLGVMLGREVTGALLFRHPTLRAFAHALGEDGASLPSQDVRAQVVADSALTLNVANRADTLGAAGAVLLTGATGFLGTHLLDALSQARDVYCIVRAGNLEQARERLWAALTEQKVTVARERVHVLVGDLGKARLGLSTEDHQRLTAACSVIVHNGASVSLARGYSSLRATNVDATRELLTLAATGPHKTVHYVSTLATALGARENGLIEERFVDYHATLRDGYSQSKWASEQLLAQAETAGLSVKVYRLGRLVGPLATATVHRDDLVWRMIVAGVRAQALPMLTVREPWTPVDVVARLIAAEALAPSVSEGAVLNVAPNALVSLRDVVRWTRSYGYPIADCEPEAFPRQLERSARDIDPATVAMFEAQRHGPIPSLTTIDTTRCRQAMTRARLVWPEISELQLHRYLDTCVASGLLPPARELASSHL